MDGVDTQEHDNQRQRHHDANEPLGRHLGLLLCNLRLLLLGAIDDGELGGIVFLGTVDGGIQRVADIHARQCCGITQAGTLVGPILFQEQLLEIIERGLYIIFAGQTVDVLVVVGSLTPPVSGHQVIAGIEAALRCLAEARCREGLISLAGLLGSTQAFKDGSPIDVQSGFLLVHVGGLGVWLPLVLLENGQEAVVPLQGILIAPRDHEVIGHINDTGDKVLIGGIGTVLLDALQMALVGGFDTLSLGLLELAETCLIAANEHQQVVVVARGVVAQRLHLLGYGHSYLQRTLVVALD